MVLFVLRREFSSKNPIKAVLNAFTQSRTAAQALLLSPQKINTRVSLLRQLHCAVIDVNSALLHFSTCPEPHAASLTPVTLTFILESRLLSRARASNLGGGLTKESEEKDLSRR